MSSLSSKSKPLPPLPASCVTSALAVDLQTTLATRLKTAISTALTPYTNYRRFARTKQKTNQKNATSSSACAGHVALPGDLLWWHSQQSQNSPSSSSPPLHAVAKHWNTWTQAVLEQCVTELEQQFEQHEELSIHNDDDDDDDSGTLGVHVIILPAAHVTRPSVASTGQTFRTKKRRRPYHPGQSQQGGDPRLHLEQRLPRPHWSINQALEVLSSQTTTGAVSTMTDTAPSTGTANNDDSMYEVFVTIWRKPIYLQSTYTKTRRDVSQTPFFVATKHASQLPDNPKSTTRLQRKGMTSVEEEILPAIVHACGGFLTHNNDDSPNGTGLRFGGAKFHASGREDMDVRMLLPTKRDTGTLNKHITGRPFVCQITDAARVPTRTELHQAVCAINHVSEEEDAKQTDHCILSAQSHGQNPQGVGIAPGLHLVPATAFASLQADTEDKVKHYACRCWSANVLPPDTVPLVTALGEFPVTLQQPTPIRVLHRRSNLVRTRRVLSCQAERIDDHHFHIRISTEAGTYVKEFVHGDLGRTQPSIASRLGCKAHLLELDCEGIEK